MKNRKLVLVVGLVVMCTVLVALVAIADCGKPGCGPGGAQMGAGCAQTVAGTCPKMGNAGCALKAGRGLSPAVSRGYSGGVVNLRVGACGTIVLAVLAQGNRPDVNASLDAYLSTAAGRQSVALQQIKPGVFKSSPGVAAAGKLNVVVSAGGATSDTVSFDVTAPASGPGGPCPMKVGGGCGKQQGGCALMSSAGAACTPTAGGCSKLGAGGCATMGACKQQGAKTAACKCAVCKCSPCKCK